MTVVVSDTSPLGYLIQINCEHCLPALYERVLVPQAVVRELAVVENADLLLMDERAGVAVARNRGLIVTGTLGVLLQASRRGLVEIDSALSALQATSFRSTPALIEDMRRRARIQKRF